MGEIDYEGKLQMGHNSMIGYFAQNQASLLDVDLTVFETIDQIAQGDIRTKIKDILGAFMFSGDTIDKKVKSLIRRRTHSTGDDQIVATTGEFVDP